MNRRRRHHTQRIRCRLRCRVVCWHAKPAARQAGTTASPHDVSKPLPPPPPLSRRRLAHLASMSCSRGGASSVGSGNSKWTW